MTQDGTSSVKIVECTDKEAQYTVLGRVEGQTQVGAGLSACSRFPETTTTYWQGESDAASAKGYVLCLKRL